MNTQNDDMNEHDFEEAFEEIKVVKLSNGKFAKCIECNDKIQVLFAGRHLGRGYTARIDFQSRDEMNGTTEVVDVSGKAVSEIVYEDALQYAKNLDELRELDIS